MFRAGGGLLTRNMVKSWRPWRGGWLRLGCSREKWSLSFCANAWEFCATYHAATLAGGIPTLLNPTYREREVRYQLENWGGAVLLITDGPNVNGINLAGLPNLRK